MGFPLVAFLLVCAHGFESDELVCTVQDCIAFRAPDNCVNRFCVILNEIGSEAAISRPDFERSVLAGGGQGTAIVAPFEVDNGLGMCISNDFLSFSSLVINPEGAIGKANGKDITGAFGGGDPVMIGGKGVELDQFVGLRGGGVPFVDDVVVSDADVIAKGTW